MSSQRSEISAEAQARLLDWLQQKMPEARDLTISNVKMPQGGFAAETFFFDLSYVTGGQHKTEKLVLKRPPQEPIFPDFDIGLQFRVMDCLQGTKVPVPKTYWLERDASIIGSPFYIAGRIEGVSPPDFPLYHTFGCYYDAPVNLRKKMYWGTVEAMARVHSLDWKSLGLSFLGIPVPGASPLDQLLNYYEKYLEWVKDAPEEPQPVMETALRWLRENRYTPSQLTLCWGDCRMPNTIYRTEGEVLGVLDWDVSFIGDPEADLAWFLFFDWHHSEGYGLPRLEGTPGREETVRQYQELTGRDVKHLFYNEVLAPFKFGVSQLKIFKLLKKRGVKLPFDDVEVNNAHTHRLAELLNLPAPGPKREMKTIQEEEISVQLHLTGPGGSDWHVACDKGKADLRWGTVPKPALTLTISAADWQAIQRGELGRTDAWLTGKLKIEGDLVLLQQLENTLSNISIPLQL